MKRFLPFVALVGLLSLNGCYNDAENVLYPLACDVSTVNYTDDILPIINASCATPGCHVTGGTGNGLFEDFTGVKGKVDNGSFSDRVVTQRNMPPSTPLSDCDIQKIQAWLDAGAPNN